MVNVVGVFHSNVVRCCDECSPSADLFVCALHGTGIRFDARGPAFAVGASWYLVTGRICSTCWAVMIGRLTVSWMCLPRGVPIFATGVSDALTLYFPSVGPAEDGDRENGTPRGD